MVAHAFAMNDHDVVIYSKQRRKSEMYGAQYLHAPIPGMTERAGVTLRYELRGTAEGYRRKVYDSALGKAFTVSPEDLEGEHLAWDIRQTYNALWETYGEYVQDHEVNPPNLANWQTHSGADLIVSTVPAPELCMDPAHSFTMQQVWAIGDAPERGRYSPVRVAKNTVVCNGEENPAWYRASNVYGHATVEWSGPVKPPLSDVAQVVKPIKTTCNCFPNVVRMGRYGKWAKGVLTHHAFNEAVLLATEGVQEALF